MGVEDWDSWNSGSSVLPSTNGKHFQSVISCHVLSLVPIGCHWYQLSVKHLTVVLWSLRMSGQPVPKNCICSQWGKNIYSSWLSFRTLLKVTDSQSWESYMTVSIFSLASCTVELCWTHCIRCAARARRPVKTSSRLAWHWPLEVCSMSFLLSFSASSILNPRLSQMTRQDLQNCGFEHCVVCWWRAVVNSVSTTKIPTCFWKNCCLI